jgi:hypothetical protein
MLATPASSLPTADDPTEQALHAYWDAKVADREASNRLCADRILLASYQALDARLRRARDALVSKFGDRRVGLARYGLFPPPQMMCDDREEAATSLREFDQALVRLERLLR